MLQAPQDHPAAATDTEGAAGDPHAELALQQSLVIMAPLVRWLLRSGVHYGTLAQALKGLFLSEARRELERTGGKVTDSALSVLSGVHRKDVRLLMHRDQPEVMFTPTPASALFTRWITDPRYRVHDGQGDAAHAPVRERLPRLGEAPSFESLARDTSTDVHPRTLLEELVRLSLVRLEGEDVVLVGERFVPGRQDADAASLMAANGADHLAAAVHNLTIGEGPRFLEQAVFARRLSAESVEKLADHARDIWTTAFESMVQAATARSEADEGKPDRSMRMRFGVYYYHDRFDAAPEGAPAKANDRKSKP